MTLVAEQAPDKTPDRIAGMFDAIAPRYDLLNHLLSAGIDRRWRTKMIASLKLTGRETLVDVCTGTADVALEARRGAQGNPHGTAARVLGVDFAGAMLALIVVEMLPSAFAAGRRLAPAAGFVGGALVMLGLSLLIGV